MYNRAPNLKAPGGLTRAQLQQEVLKLKADNSRLQSQGGFNQPFQTSTPKGDGEDICNGLHVQLKDPITTIREELKHLQRDKDPLDMTPQDLLEGQEKL